MLDRIKGLLGGPATERLVFVDASTGEEGDLGRAAGVTDETRARRDEPHSAARRILSHYRNELDRLARALLERGTLEAAGHVNSPGAGQRLGIR